MTQTIHDEAGVRAGFSGKQRTEVEAVRATNATLPEPDRPGWDESLSEKARQEIEAIINDGIGSAVEDPLSVQTSPLPDALKKIREVLLKGGLAKGEVWTEADPRAERCRAAQHGVVSKGNTIGALTFRCMRQTCPGCRPYTARLDHDRMLTAFAGGDCYDLGEIAPDRIAAVMKKLQRAGADHAGIPAEDGYRRVFATVPVLDSDELLPAERRSAVVMEALEARPEYRKGEGRRGSISGSHGFMKPREQVREERREAAGRRSTWTFHGWWNPDRADSHEWAMDHGFKATEATPAKAYADAARLGLPVEVLSVPDKGITGALVTYDPKNFEECAAVTDWLRKIGFQRLPGSESSLPEGITDWRKDPRIGFDHEPDQLSMEAA